MAKTAASPREPTLSLARMLPACLEAVRGLMKRDLANFRWLLSVTNGRCIFVSDNPAYDFQWINYGFHHAIGRNPFGHSGRRISDFYAGLVGRFQQQPGLEETSRHSPQSQSG